MGLHNSQPLTFRPHGLSDTVDGSNAFQGAMANLQNLIPDPKTTDLWVCRPASTSLTTFSTFNTPAFVSTLKVVGTLAYGMIASARNVGNDEPFCYDLVAGSFIAVTGITGLNTPVSPLATGAWTPPTMDLIGTKLVVTHPGFTGGGGNFFGWFDVSNPAAPTWNAGNTAPTALPAAPVGVAQFNGRAWFLVNPAAGQPGVYYSDELAATVITAGTQVLTFDDNVPLIAAAGLPLDNQLGGIIQSLIIFKKSNLYQVLGDATTSNLSKNALNVATGTASPNSVVTTPKGIAFISREGLRLVGFDARVSDPVGFAGTGITVPFVTQLVPSRTCAAYNVNVYRVSVQNGDAIGTPQQEYWYDFVRQVWSGPHSFPSSLIAPYDGTFVKTPIGVTASLWQSDIVQSLTSTYVENSAQMTFAWQTALLPDTEQMCEHAMVETTVDMAFASGVVYSAQVLDENGAVIDSVTLQATGASTIWGAFTWGQALWQGAANNLAARQLPWHFPIVFQRMSINVSGNSAPGYKIGNMHMRYQQLGYLKQ